MVKLAGSATKYPARLSIVWYLGVITLGSLVLMHPVCLEAEAQPMAWIDAVFTATSATCVTGLVTRRTGSELSWVGQAVVLVLIQVGGIGILTFTTLVTLRVRKRAGVRERLILFETIGARETSDLRQVLWSVLSIALAIELVGFLLLAAHHLVSGWRRTEGSLAWNEALWHALFHSVSAFCNAGFALFDDSLVRYRGDVWVNIVVMALIVVGGLGFPVLLELRRWLLMPENRRWDRLSLHTKLMLLGTAGIFLLGFAATLLLEWDGALKGSPWGERILAAAFHSVTCRTAGFNTVDLTTMTNATLFVSILLMMIGAGPCSTAGGFKVSTVMVLLLRAWNTFQGREKINVFRRTIPNDTANKAIVTALMFGVVTAAALTLLLVVEQSSIPHSQTGGLFIEALFEVVSALGTVGLSIGLTDKLTVAGKMIIIALMLLGRLGPITLFEALSRVEGHAEIEHPAEEPLIG
ncbi:MAG: K+ transporter Trk [Pirellulaceae bacterium]|nr:MAG: K+ transporter Trk [Pirellulaceae bacterium]GIW95423.1 MAG: K+ transporter Trk [Pirellulaceae bacterium]